MTQSDAVLFWITSAEHDLQTARDMFKTHHYDWCLFMWHLVLEKTLKAIISHRGNTPFPIHNLLKLSEQANLEIDLQSQNDLKEITSFNLEARYDDYKFAFYKKATKEYAEKWQSICEKHYQNFIQLCK